MIDKDTLIGKQQIEIQELKTKLNELLQNNDGIRQLIYCIGGPLNGNKLGYSQEQKEIFRKIANLTVCLGEI